MNVVLDGEKRKAEFFGNRLLLFLIDSSSKTRCSREVIRPLISVVGLFAGEDRKLLATSENKVDKKLAGTNRFAS